MKFKGKEIAFLLVICIGFVAPFPLDDVAKETADIKLEDCPDCPIYGDILRADPNDLNAIADKNKHWTNGEVAYVIANELEPHTALIRDAMNEIEKVTCLKFVERTTTQKYYINIFKGKPGDCSSMVGMVRPGQPLSLGGGCLYKPLIIHELGHAIGFEHEHQRSDRDDYITIVWENINPKYKFAFRKLSPRQNRLINKFDFSSIMLYGERAFSKDYRNVTMKSKIPGARMVEVYNKPGLSQSDIERINILYDCGKQ